ncbi:MAG TPA: protein kinase [Polyangiaceae bacterium]
MVTLGNGNARDELLTPVVASAASAGIADGHACALLLHFGRSVRPGRVVAWSRRAFATRWFRPFHQPARLAIIIGKVAVCSRCSSIVPEAAQFCPECGAQIARKPTALTTGSEINLEDWGRAVLGHVIGEGGMGVVYRGWLYYNPAGRLANTPPHPVAVKLLHPELQGRRRARKMFLREAGTLARLSHPNVVHFFGLSEQSGQLALVLELVHGEPLSDLIQRLRLESRRNPNLPCLPLAQAWHYFAQLLGALAAIHALGILHRDVKSSNVLVRADGVAKITDFGIAQVPAEDAKETGGSQPGTGAYMSPEQVLGKPLDPRSDLYSAAIVLFEMLTGVTPFDSPERNELMIRTAQVDEAPAAPSRLIKQAPPMLDLLMARALAKDPTHRYGSAIELGEAFRSAFGLPDSPGWQLEQRLADVAKTMSDLELRAETPAPDVAAEAAEVGTGIMTAFSK